MKYYASCSFGKDSLATILLALEMGEPLDGAVYVEVMFDSQRGISGEDPEHIKWIRNVAAPRLESMGCPVTTLRSDIDYVTYFHMPISRGPRKGRPHGFPYSRQCSLQRECKLRPIRKWLAGRKITQYVGIAADETKRLKALDEKNCVSLLAKYGYTEAMAMELCEKHGLVSPIYAHSKRNGCWFCPNATVGHFARLRREHADLWGELKTLGESLKSGPCVSDRFRWGQSLDDLERSIDRMEWRERCMKETLLPLWEGIDTGPPREGACAESGAKRL